MYILILLELFLPISLQKKQGNPDDILLKLSLKIQAKYFILIFSI